MGFLDTLSDFGGFDTPAEGGLDNLFQGGDLLGDGSDSSNLFRSGDLFGGEALQLDRSGLTSAAPEDGRFVGGLKDFGSKLGSQITSDPLKALTGGLGLGVGALGAVNAIKQAQHSGQQQGVVERSQRALQGVGSAGAQAGAALTTAGSGALLGGPLPSGLQAEADLWRSDARQRVRSFAAKAGITDSTMMATMENQIDLQYSLLKEKLAESLLSGGTAASAGSLGPLSSAANSAQAQLNSADAAINAAYKSLAVLMGQTGSSDHG